MVFHHKCRAGVLALRDIMKSLKRNENLCVTVQKNAIHTPNWLFQEKKKSHKLIQSITDDFFSLMSAHMLGSGKTS